MRSSGMPRVLAIAPCRSASAGLSGGAKNARQTSEIELYRDFAPYSFLFKQRYADGSLGVVGGLVYHGSPDCSCCYTLEKINGWSIHT